MTEIQNNLTEISNIFLKEDINEQDKIQAQNKLKDINNQLKEIKKSKFYKIEFIKIKLKYGDSETYIKRKKKIKICKLVEKDMDYYQEKYRCCDTRLDYKLFKKNKIHIRITQTNDLAEPIFFQDNIDYHCTTNLLITKIEEYQ